MRCGVKRATYVLPACVRSDERMEVAQGSQVQQGVTVAQVVHVEDIYVVVVAELLGRSVTLTIESAAIEEKPEAEMRERALCSAAPVNLLSSCRSCAAKLFNLLDGDGRQRGFNS
jgi:hypothetical protein